VPSLRTRTVPSPQGFEGEALMDWSDEETAAQVAAVLGLIRNIHLHVTSLIVGVDLTEAERQLRHALKVLQSREATA